MMNERMLELYRQAQVPHTAIDPSNNMPYQTTCFSAEKFAGLVVNDCLNVLCEEMDKLGIDLSNLPKWYKAIENTEINFGIK